jgi:hypothetical protein
MVWLPAGELTRQAFLVIWHRFFFRHVMNGLLSTMKVLVFLLEGLIGYAEHCSPLHSVWR